MNPFLNWTEAQVAAHNAKVKEYGNALGTYAELAEKPEFETSLTLQPSTDEEKLNKLERAWLYELRRTHPETHVGVQSITLKLANDCRYSPDFWTIDPNGQLIFWETKGYFRDDAAVKLKVAARKFRHFRFVLVEKKKGQWIETPIKP